jgi:hypothetical protein
MPKCRDCKNPAEPPFAYCLDCLARYRAYQARRRRLQGQKPDPTRTLARQADPEQESSTGNQQ